MTYQYFILTSKYNELTSKFNEVDKDLHKTLKTTFGGKKVVKDAVVNSERLQKLLPANIFTVDTQNNKVVYNGIKKADLRSYRKSIIEIGKEMAEGFGEKSLAFLGIWNGISKLHNLPFDGIYILDGVPYYPIELLDMILGTTSAGGTFELVETGKMLE